MAIKEGQTATNKATGARVVYRAGAWQPVTGAQPVKLATREEQTLAETRDAGKRAMTTLSQLDAFGRANEKAPTGPGRKPVEWLGLNFNPGSYGIFKGDNLQEMESISAGLAPKQREAGSGDISDKQQAAFAQSLPSIYNYGGTNARIIDRMRNQSIQDRARSSFYDEYVQKQGTLNGAPEAFQRKLDEIAAADPATAGRLVNAMVPGVNKVQRALAASKPVAKAPAKKAAALYSKYGLEQ